MMKNDKKLLNVLSALTKWLDFMLYMLYRKKIIILNYNLFFIYMFFEFKAITWVTTATGLNIVFKCDIWKW